MTEIPIGSKELKAFLETLEVQAFMGNIDPQNLSVVLARATNSFEQNTDVGKEGKRKQIEYYLLVMMVLQDLNDRMALLDAEIKALLDQHRRLVDEYNRMAELLDCIDDLVHSESAFDRDQAINIIEELTSKTPDPNLSDADLRNLLKMVELDTRQKMTGLESEIEELSNKIKDKSDEYDLLEAQANSVQSTLNNANLSADELKVLSSGASQIIELKEQLSGANQDAIGNQLSEQADALARVEIDLGALNF